MTRYYDLPPVRRRRRPSRLARAGQGVVIGLVALTATVGAYRYSGQLLNALPPLPVAAPTAVVLPTAVPVIRPAIIVPGAPPVPAGQPTPLPLIAPATDNAPAVHIAPASIDDARREQLNSVDTPSQCVNCQSAPPVEQQPVMSGRISSGESEVVEAPAVPAVVVQPTPAKPLNRRPLTFDGKGSSQK